MTKVGRSNPRAAVVAVTEYEKFNRLEAAERAAIRLAELLGDGGYELAPELNFSPANLGELTQRLNTWFTGVERDSVLFIYWTGHGEVNGSSHFLMCSDSPKTGHTQLNSLATGTLGTAIAASQAEKVFLIVDTCYSGAGAISVVDGFNELQRGFAPVPGRSRDLAVIGTSHALERADETAFVDRLIDVLTRPSPDIPWTDNSQFLRPNDIAEIVQKRLTADGYDVQVDFHARGLSQDFILNPRFRPNLPAETAELAMARSRGEPAPFAEGFFGRARLLGRLSAWLSMKSGSLTVITGSVGSGKSSILSRVAGPQPDGPGDISFPRFDALVGVHGQSAEAVARKLAEEIGVDLSPASMNYGALIEQIAARQGPVRIAIDGLDEAPPFQAVELLRELITRLAALDNVWLLLGTRRRYDGSVGSDAPDLRHQQLRNALGEGATIIDLDDEVDANRDVAKYVRLRLSALKGQVDQRQLARRRDQVTRQARGNFLYATLVTRSILDNPKLAFGDRLPETAIEAFEGDLMSRFTPEELPRAQTLLTALAWSEGEGLSRRLWPEVATLISGQDFSDSDVTLLLSRAAFQVVESSAVSGGAQQAVYRLFHQALTDHLRAAILPWVELEVFDTLTERHGRRARWTGLDPYLRRHLPSHAVRVNRLEALLEDIGFLAASEPSHLQRVLDGIEGKRAREAAGIYRRAIDRLVDLKPLERLPHLHLTAWLNRQELHRSWRPTSEWSWYTVWSNTLPSTEHNVQQRPDSAIGDIAILETPQGAVLVTALDSGAVEFVSVEKQSSWEMDPHPHYRGASSLTTVIAGKRPWVLSTGMDAGVCLFDPIAEEGVTRVQLENEWYRHFLSEGTTGHWMANPPRISATSTEDVGLIVAGPFDGALVLLGLADLVEEGSIELGADWNGCFVAIGDKGRLFLFISHGARVERIDLLSGHSIPSLLPDLPDNIVELAVGTLTSRRVLLTRDRRGCVRSWNPTTGDEWGTQIVANGATAMCAAGLDRETLAIAADNRIWVYDLQTGTRLGGPLLGHTKAINSLCILRNNGRPILISASDDRTVRSWPLTLSLLPTGDAEAENVSSPLPKFVMEQFALGPHVRLSRDFTFGARDILIPTRSLTIDWADGRSANHAVGEIAYIVGCATIKGADLVAVRDLAGVSVIDAESGALFGTGHRVSGLNASIVQIGQRGFVLSVFEGEIVAVEIGGSEINVVGNAPWEAIHISAALVGGETVLAVCDGEVVRFGMIVEAADGLDFIHHDFECLATGCLGIGESVSGPHILAATTRGTVLRLDPRSGRLLCEVRTGDSVQSIHCYAKGDALIELISGLVILRFND